MKKILLFTMLVAVASLFTSCENADVKTAQNMAGTWEGSTFFGEDEYPADYQFFPDEKGNTGRFVEIDYLSITDEVGDVTYEMPYSAYVGGKYTVKDGTLYLEYDVETAWVYIEEEPVTEYVTAFLEFDRESGAGEWLDANVEDLVDYFIESRTEDLGNSWEEIIKDFNTGLEYGYGDLKVTDTQISYHTSDLGVLTFTRSEDDVFEKYPF